MEWCLSKQRDNSDPFFHLPCLVKRKSNQAFYRRETNMDIAVVETFGNCATQVCAAVAMVTNSD